MPVETKLCTVHDKWTTHFSSGSNLYHFLHDAWCVFLIFDYTRHDNDAIFSCGSSLLSISFFAWCMTCFLLCSTYNRTTCDCTAAHKILHTTGQTWGQINTGYLYQDLNMHICILILSKILYLLVVFRHLMYSNMHHLVDFISFFNHFKCLTKLPHLMQSVCLLSHATAPKFIHHQHWYFKLKSSYICSSLFYLHFKIAYLKFKYLHLKRLFYIHSEMERISNVTPKSGPERCTTWDTKERERCSSTTWHRLHCLLLCDTLPDSARRSVSRTESVSSYLHLYPSLPLPLPVPPSHAPRSPPPLRPRPPPPASRGRAPDH